MHDVKVSGTWPLTGRSEELERLRELLTGPACGLVLAGDAGVGKTRLALECLKLAQYTGAVVTRVNATRAASTLPLGAFAPLLPAEGDADTSGLQDRTDLLRRCASALVASAGGERLIVLVDDAHLLDDASATLVHQLVSTRAAFVVVTLRTGEPVPDPIMSVWKDDTVERWELGSLDADTVGQLLIRVLGGPVDQESVTRLTRTCEGNVLLLRELILGAASDGTLRKDMGIWRLVGPLAPSNRLVEIVQARLDGLSDAERKLLEIVSFGEPLGPAELATLADESIAESLEAKGLLTSSIDGRRLQLRLAHPLYGDVLRALTPPLRARRVVRALAEAVEATGARRREDVLRVATWRLEGGDGKPDVMLEAASIARWRYDFLLAERLARAAVQAGAGFDAALLHAQLMYLQGRGDDAETELTALSKQATDDRQRALVAIARLDNRVFLIGQSDEGLEIAEEAEAAIQDSAWRDEIAAKRAAVVTALHGPRSGVEVFEQVLKQSDGRAAVWAAIPASFALGRLGRLAAAADAASRGRTVHLSLDEPLNWYPWHHTFFRAEALAHAGRLDDAYALATEQYQQGIADHSPEAQAWFSWQLCKMAGERGHPRTAAVHGRAAAALFHQLGQPQFEHFALGHLALALALTGDSAEATTALETLEALDLPPSYYWAADILQSRAWTAAAAGDIPTAQDHLKEAWSLAEQIGDLVGEAASLHALARLGHADDVADRLTELCTTIEGVLAPGRAKHARALAAGDAVELEDVSHDFESMGARLLAAEAAADAAVMWRQAEGNPRRSAAAENRADMLSRQCEDPVTPALRAVKSRARLTRAEREVAMLAASGRTNREIADQLVVSKRTVENQLQRVYEKLGISRRSDLPEALGGDDSSLTNPSPC